MTTTTIVQRGRWRAKIYTPEGGYGLEYQVQGIGWVVADNSEDCPADLTTLIQTVRDILMGDRLAVRSRFVG